MARCSTALPPDLPPRAYQTISLCCASSSRRVGVARIATLAGCLRYAPALSGSCPSARGFPIALPASLRWQAVSAALRLCLQVGEEQGAGSNYRRAEIGNRRTHTSLTEAFSIPRKSPRGHGAFAGTGCAEEIDLLALRG